MRLSKLSELLEVQAKKYRFEDDEKYQTLRAASALLYFEGDLPERAALRCAVEGIEKWVPESTPLAVYEDNTEGGREAETIPFMTEAFLYPLLGKCDARTLLALWSATKKAILELEEQS